MVGRRRIGGDGGGGLEGGGVAGGGECRPGGGQAFTPDATGGGVDPPGVFGGEEEQLCLDHETSMRRGCDRALNRENADSRAAAGVGGGADGGMADPALSDDYRLGVPVPLPVTLLLAAIVVVVGCFALVDALLASRDRRRWAQLGDETVSRRAAAAVVDARRRLAAALENDHRPERAVRRHPALGNVAPGVPSGLGEAEQSSAEQSSDATVEVAGVDAAREALLDAQRLWASVRPRRDANARVGIWSGRGRLRSWQLGPIGFERIIVRSDHLIDPDCWVLTEYRRIRFGLGVGVESLDLAVFAAGVPSRRLDALLRELLRGPEVAVRPGFAPLRWWRTTRRSQSAQAATNAVFADRRLDRPPSPATSEAVWVAVREDFGSDVERMGLSGIGGPIAVAHTSGPSLLFGWWWGLRPRSRLVAASSHVVWRDPT